MMDIFFDRFMAVYLKTSFELDENGNLPPAPHLSDCCLAKNILQIDDSDWNSPIDLFTFAGGKLPNKVEN